MVRGARVGSVPWVPPLAPPLHLRDLALLRAHDDLGDLPYLRVLALFEGHVRHRDRRLVSTASVAAKGGMPTSETRKITIATRATGLVRLSPAKSRKFLPARTTTAKAPRFMAPGLLDLGNVTALAR